jgi:hypothetical protein
MEDSRVGVIYPSIQPSIHPSIQQYQALFSQSDSPSHSSLATATLAVKATSASKMDTVFITVVYIYNVKKISMRAECK